MTAGKRRGWRALPAAEQDLERLRHDHERLAVRAIALLDLIAEGKYAVEPLNQMASYGDLADCYKVYFGLTDASTHRIVYRKLESGAIEVIEAVAIEERAEGYVYLLAASRLNRLPTESKKRFNRVHQAAIAARAKRRPPSPQR